MKAANVWSWLIALIVVGCLGVWGLTQHDARVRADARLVDSARVMAVRTAYFEQRLADASSQLHTAGAALTPALGRVDTVFGGVPIVPRTKAETLAAVAALPQIKAASDAASLACHEYQNACEQYRHDADSVIAALRDERALWKGAKVFKPPRWTRYVEPQYDPVSKVVAGAIGTELRIAGPLSVTAHVVKRLVPGDTARVYIGARLTF